MSPDVIGKVKLTIESIGNQKLKPLILNERGPKMKIILHVNATEGEFTDFYLEVFRSKAMTLKIRNVLGAKGLKDFELEVNENVEIEIPIVNKKSGKKAKANCFSCEAIFEFYNEQG